MQYKYNHTLVRIEIDELRRDAMLRHQRLAKETGVAAAPAGEEEAVDHMT